MIKTRLAVIAMAGLLVGGCAGSWPVDVFLYPDGRLETDRTSIAKHEIPLFVAEVGDRAVRILPVGVGKEKVSFQQAASVRDELKSAGVKRVTIDVNGE